MTKVVLDRAMLSSVVRNVLEEAAFVFTAPADDEVRVEGEAIIAELEFEGPSSGRILLIVPQMLGEIFAANLLGEERDSDEVREHGDEAAGEILNMMAGVLLERWFGSTEQCRLGTPKVRRESDPQRPVSASGPTADLITEDEEPVIAMVVIEHLGAK